MAGAWRTWGGGGVKQRRIITRWQQNNGLKEVRIREDIYRSTNSNHKPFKAMDKHRINYLKIVRYIKSSYYIVSALIIGQLLIEPKINSLKYIAQSV